MAKPKRVTRKKLDASSFNNIKTLLSLGKFDHKQIAEMTGFSLTTIGNVKRFDTLEGHLQNQRNLTEAKKERALAEDEGIETVRVYEVCLTDEDGETVELRAKAMGMEPGEFLAAAIRDVMIVDPSISVRFSRFKRALRDLLATEV